MIANTDEKEIRACDVDLEIIRIYDSGHCKNR